MLPYDKMPLDRSFLLAWSATTPREGETDPIDNVIEHLLRLRVLVSSGERKIRCLDASGEFATREGALKLHKLFRARLQSSLVHPQRSPWDSVAAASNGLPGATSTSSDVERTCARRWNGILHFLVGDESAPPPSRAVVKLLLSTGLLQRVEADDDNDPFGVVEEEDDSVVEPRAVDDADVDKVLSSGIVRLTRSAYAFLLEDVSVQLWTFLEEYVFSAGERGVTPAQVLRFLMRLGFCSLGEGYPVESLGPTEQDLLRDFAVFGLVYLPRGERAKTFYPSSLALTVGSPHSLRQLPWSIDSDWNEPGPGDAAGAAAHRLTGAGWTGGVVSKGQSRSTLPEHGSRAMTASTAALLRPKEVQLQLIVEKTFRILAYTSESLHGHLLGLFARVDARLPNLVVATLTRDAVHTALRHGITAKQIHWFLEEHMHPRVSEAGMGLPENIIDQIYIWERERQRAQTESVMLLSDFSDLGETEAVANFLRGACGKSSPPCEFVLVVHFHYWLVDNLTAERDALIHFDRAEEVIVGRRSAQKPLGEFLRSRHRGEEVG